MCLLTFTQLALKRFILRRTFDHERRRQIRTPLGRLLLRIFLCWLQQVRLRGFVPGPLLSQFVGIHPGRGGWLPSALLQGLNQKRKAMGDHRGQKDSKFKRHKRFEVGLLLVCIYFCI